MENYKKSNYSRNFGFWNEEEQKILCDSRVAIAGVGGDGFQLGLNLVRMGVGGFSIADPEVFEKENANRVPGAIERNYGRNKAVVFEEMAKEINPDVNISVYSNGVTEENVHDFMFGANLLIDESELRYLHIATMLARTARKLMIPNMTVMNIGFAGVATAFDPFAKQNGHVSFEHLMGISESEPLDEIKSREIDLSNYLPYLPTYGDINVLQAVKEGAPLPSIVQGVDTAAALGSTEAFLHLTSRANNKRRQPTWAGKFRYMDVYSGEAGVIEIPKVEHYLRLATIVGRSALRMNPHASYSLQERLSREQ